MGVGQLLRDGIRDAALSGAEQTGQLFAELELGPEEYAGRKLTATAPKDLDLGARAVAEGVESAAAARHLTQIGCDAMQRFHLSRPLPSGELEQWLRDLPSNAGGCEDHRPLVDAATANL